MEFYLVYKYKMPNCAAIEPGFNATGAPTNPKYLESSLQNRAACSLQKTLAKVKSSGYGRGGRRTRHTKKRHAKKRHTRRNRH
jgi:hypothetical protein